MCNIALVTFFGLQYWSSVSNIYKHVSFFCVLTLEPRETDKNVLKLSGNFLKIGSWNFTSCCWEPCNIDEQSIHGHSLEDEPNDSPSHLTQHMASISGLSGYDSIWAEESTLLLIKVFWTLTGVECRSQEEKETIWAMECVVLFLVVIYFWWTYHLPYFLLLMLTLAVWYTQSTLTANMRFFHSSE